MSHHVIHPSLLIASNIFVLLPPPVAQKSHVPRVFFQVTYWAMASPMAIRVWTGAQEGEKVVKGREKPYLEDLGGFGGVVRLVRLIFVGVIMVTTSISWDMGFLWWTTLVFKTPLGGWTVSGDTANLPLLSFGIVTIHELGIPLFGNQDPMDTWLWTLLKSLPPRELPLRR